MPDVDSPSRNAPRRESSTKNRENSDRNANHGRQPRVNDFRLGIEVEVKTRHFQFTRSHPMGDDGTTMMPRPLDRSNTQRSHAVQHRVLGAYPLLPISPSRNTLDSRDNSYRDNTEQMSAPPHDGTSRSSARRSRSQPRRVTHLPQPSDVHISPDDPVSGQAAELIHEFIHPHHHHDSQDNLLETEEELDEAGGDAAIIAKELEEMQNRVWWRRPSALWYARFCIPLSVQF